MVHVGLETDSGDAGLALAISLSRPLTAILVGPGECPRWLSGPGRARMCNVSPL